MTKVKEGFVFVNRSQRRDTSLMLVVPLIRFADMLPNVISPIFYSVFLNRSDNLAPIVSNGQGMREKGYVGESSKSTERDKRVPFVVENLLLF